MDWQRSLPTVAARALLIVLAVAGDLGAADGIDPARYLGEVKRLSAPEMEGRAEGSPQLDQAADWIASVFRSLNLQPAGDRGFFQRFPISMNGSLGDGNRFRYRLDGKWHKLASPADFVPLSFSPAGKAKGELVFAGYGISAPEYGYDDYAGVETRGKIVVILRHEPQEYDRDSIFAGKVYTEHAQLYSKADNARLHGARALLLVNDTSQHGDRSGSLIHFNSLPSPAVAGMPVVHVASEVVGRWFRASGRKWDEVQERINADLRPHSFAFPAGLRVSLRADVHSETRPVRNVAAYLPGNTPEYVILGAHYDHIGHGEQFSMAPSRAGEIHPGADDNASGTAGLLELARWFAAHPTHRRGILFVAFRGEELGLLGSSYYVRYPVRPIRQAVAMINMDMIGRIRDGQVYVGGTGTGTTLRHILESHREGSGLRLDFSATIGYGSSDHTSFLTRKVPVLFFFSGLHGDYHRPGDTWDRIMAEPACRLLQYIAAVTRSLAEQETRPEYQSPGL